MRKTVIAAAAAFAVASGAATFQQASAADLDFAPPPPPFVPTWQGFYIGGHVGYGEGTVDFRQDLDIFTTDAAGTIIDSDFNTFRRGFSPDGLLGGAQGGFNWQTGSVVFGVEADISFTDWDQGGVVFDSEAGDDVDGLLPGEETFGTASTDIDFLASVRGRVGYAFDSVMIYGTGGVAWAEAEARSFIAFDDPNTQREVSGKASLDDFGFVAGAGLAWMVIPQTFSVGVEGLHYWFDEKATLIDETSVPIQAGLGDAFATAELHNAWVVRARADFHF